MKHSKFIIMLTGLTLVLTLSACMNDNNALDDNENPNISADSTEKSSSNHVPAEFTRQGRDDLPPESTWYDPLRDPEGKRNPPARNQVERGNDADNQVHPRTQPTEGMNEFTSAVISLTNEERRKLGLNDLITDDTLNKVALEKAQNMQERGYFSHNSPTYGTPFEMMHQYGVDFKSGGENIAHGQPTAQEVVQAWMDSPGHRANIVNSSYTHIGVGYVSNGDYWAQMFIER